MERKSSNLPYFVLAGAALALIILAWIGRDAFQPLGPGARAPAFQARALDGRMVSLSDFEGKVVLLNIWATWCPPCVEEMPSMQRLAEALRGEDFEVVAVSIDAPRGERDPQGQPGGDIQAFVESLGIDFLILHDPAGDIRMTYQTYAVPESFVIGRDGIIYRKVSGATDWDRPEYIEFLRRLLDSDG